MIKTTLPKKTFQRNGKWIVKPSQTLVSECGCGSKYIKTREQQTACLKCFTKNLR